MAYETGIANGPDDLLDKIRLFASANGWTVNHWGAITNGQWLSLSRDGQFVNLVSENVAGPDHDPGPYIRMRGAIGFNAANAWSSQPGTSGTSYGNGLGGPYTAYHFFGGESYLHTVVEVSAGVFKHLVFGNLVKIGDYVGGAYVGGLRWYSTGSSIVDNPMYNWHTYLFDYDDTWSTNSRMRVRADLDGQTWFDFIPTSSTSWRRAQGPYRTNGLMDSLIERSPNAFNGLTPLLPIYVSVERDGGLFSPIGHAPDMRVVNMRHLTPGETVTLGSDEWRVFPAIIKKNPGLRDGQPNSGWYGYAYRKVV